MLASIPVSVVNLTKFIMNRDLLRSFKNATQKTTFIGRFFPLQNTPERKTEVTAEGQ